MGVRQIIGSSTHDVECKRRLIEMHDKQLFTQPDESYHGCNGIIIIIMMMNDEEYFAGPWWWVIVR